MQDYEDYELEGGARRIRIGANHALPPTAMGKAAVWRGKVMALYAQKKGTMKNGKPYTYKDALIELGSGKTKVARTQALDAARDKYWMKKHGTPAPVIEHKSYRPKNKKPLTLDAARRVLVNWYRARARAGLLEKPMRGLRNDISRCSKNPKRTLVPCPVDANGKMIVNRECQDNWHYRPRRDAGNKMMTYRTGPGMYDMDGLDNFCGAQKTAGRATAAYRKRTIQKHPNLNRPHIPKKGNPRYTKNAAGRYVLAAGQAPKLPPRPKRAPKRRVAPQPPIMPFGAY
jgi:hypothetical protein